MKRVFVKKKRFEIHKKETKSADNNDNEDNKDNKDIKDNNINNNNNNTTIKFNILKFDNNINIPNDEKKADAFNDIKNS